MGPFKDIAKFLKDSRIAKALTDRTKVYESHVRMFWKSVRYEESEKTIYSTVQKKDENDKDIDVNVEVEVKFNVGDVRRVLDLQDSDDDPIIVPQRLCKGLWFRMGFYAHVNDKYLKSKFFRPYKFLVHCVVHALSHRKGAYDETSDYIMNIITFQCGDVRRLLDLQDSDDDPIIVPERLCKGLWFRMGFSTHVNDKYLKSKFCRPYKFLVHCVVHALSHRKGAYDETSDYIMNIITCMMLNRPYNIS
ncbi:hypothetical protein Hdeb2414_s0009g00315041 [Helianthus debilis subsp. tardiflorus]